MPSPIGRTTGASRPRPARCRCSAGASAALVLVLALLGTVTPACRGSRAQKAASTTTTTTSPAPAPAPSPPAPVEIVYRIDVHADVDASAVEATLHDPRGWERAGFRFVRRDDGTAPYRIVLAEAAEVQALCRPYDVFGKYSCQNGPVVALNGDRWRTATPQWTGDVPTYRQMLVNHEVGHLLGMHHPDVQCPERGRPAAIMAQQSTELDGCLPNPWPLADEVERAARHDQPLAPPFSR